jgi:hypothetical protein
MLDLHQTADVVKETDGRHRSFLEDIHAAFNSCHGVGSS